MKQTLPYHPLEHCGPPTCPTEVLEDELRMHPDQDSFIEGLGALTLLYGPSRLGRSFSRASRMLFTATAERAFERGEDFESDIIFDAEFLAGSTFAVHIVTKPLDEDRQRHVFGSDLLGLTNLEEMGDDAPEIMEQAIEDIAQFRDEGWHARFDALPPELQVGLKDVSFQLYYYKDELPGKVAYAIDSFLAGFAYANGHINEALDQKPEGAPNRPPSTVFLNGVPTV